MKIETLLRLAVEAKASDLHLRVGIPPILRINGHLIRQEHFLPLTNDDIADMLGQIASPEQKERLAKEKELDFAYPLDLSLSA